MPDVYLVQNYYAFGQSMHNCSSTVAAPTLGWMLASVRIESLQHLHLSWEPLLVLPDTGKRRCRKRYRCKTTNSILKTMNTKSNLSTRTTNSIYLFFIVVFALTSIKLCSNYTRVKASHKSLISKEIRGKIVSLTNLGRGSYEVDIRDINQIYRLESYPLAWEVKKYNILVGDSVSKDPNSKIIIFYKEGKEVCKAEL